MPDVTVTFPAPVEATAPSWFVHIWDGTWKTYDLETQLSMRKSFATFVDGVNTLRAKFDEQVWAGHEDGTVNPKVESIRAKRTGETGGRKAAPKSMEDLLFNKNK